MTATQKVQPPKYLHVYVTAANDDGVSPLIRLDAIRNLRLNLDAYERVLAAAARRDGASWSEVGRALGVTRQAAAARLDGCT